MPGKFLWKKWNHKSFEKVLEICSFLRWVWNNEYVFKRKTYKIEAGIRSRTRGVFIFFHAASERTLTEKFCGHSNRSWGIIHYHVWTEISQIVGSGTFGLQSWTPIGPHVDEPGYLLPPVQSQWQRLVRRMTRFFTTVNADVSLSALKDACDGLALGFKLTCTNQVRRAVLKGNGVHFTDVECMLWWVEKRPPAHTHTYTHSRATSCS